MTNNVKACTFSELDKMLPWGLAKMCKNTASFLKKMVVNRYANHVLRIFNCMLYVLLQNFAQYIIYDIVLHSVYNYAALQNNP